MPAALNGANEVTFQLSGGPPFASGTLRIGPYAPGFDASLGATVVSLVPSYTYPFVLDAAGRHSGLLFTGGTSRELHYQVIVALAPESKKAFPKAPTKVVCLDWSVEDPSKVTGSPAEIKAAYESTYQFLHSHIQDLVEAVLGDKID